MILRVPILSLTRRLKKGKRSSAFPLREQVVVQNFPCPQNPRMLITRRRYFNRLIVVLVFSNLSSPNWNGKLM